MKNDSINYVLVGTFVVAMVAALLFAIALLTGRTGATDTYLTRYDDATGLKYGSKVLYMGFPVGQVEKIEPVVKDGKMLFELKLAVTKELSEWRVPADSVAEVRAAGLLAPITIDIRAGKSKQALEPGGRLEGRGRSDMFAAMQETASTLRDVAVNNVRPLLENLNTRVTNFGEVLDTKGGPLIANLSKLSTELAGRAPEVIDAFLDTTADLRGVSARLRALLSEENERKVGTVLDNVALVSGELARLAKDAEGLLEILLGPADLAGVGRFIEDASQTATQTLALSRSAGVKLDRALSEENLGHVERSLANVEQVTVRAGRLLSDENLASIERSVANVERTIEDARSLVDEETQASVDATLDNVEQASVGLRALVADTRGQVGSLLGPETRKRLDRTLDNVSLASANIATLSTALESRLGEILTPEMSAKLKLSLENFASAAGSIARLSNGLLESRQLLDALLVSLNETTNENRPGIRDSVRALRHSLQVVSRHIDTVANNLEGTSRNLFELSRRLKGNPGLLLRTPEAVDEARRTGGGG